MLISESSSRSRTAYALVVLSGAFVVSCGGADASVVHDCHDGPADGTPCDFVNGCSMAWDGIDDRWGMETWDCVDGHVVYVDATWTMASPSTACASIVTGPPTVTLPLSAFDLGPVVGMNLDALNNSAPPAGMGVSVNGCGVLDAQGGIDNGLAAAATNLAGSVDVRAALSALFAPTVMDGGAAAGGVDVQLFDLDPSTVDNLVCARLVFHSPGHADASVIGYGGSVNHVVTLLSAGEQTLELAPTTDSTHCVNQQCTAGVLPVRVARLRALLALNPAHTELVAPSVLAGSVFFQDCEDGTVDPGTGACTGGTFAAQNAVGLRESFRGFAASASLTPAFTADVLTALQSARDLHEQSNGDLSLCAGASVTTTNRNAISFGFAIDSAAP